VASHWRAVCGIKTGKGIKREALKQASRNLVKQIYNADVNDDISDAICLGMAYLAEHKSAF
jgi:Asp/Glu/hydantoin racemase